MLILNSSGLVVQVLETVPTVPAGAWGNPSWPQGSVGNIQVSPQLGQAVASASGFGPYDLGGKVLGVRGSVLISFVTGAPGSARTLAYLTDNTTSPANRIALGLDGLNRPDLALYDYFGTLKASVMPTYPGMPAGAQGQVILSWDSTQAIDGTRFALLQVNSGAIPSGDWVTNPIAAWTSFQPTTFVLGSGVGSALAFNGQLISVQVSNDVVTGGSGSRGQFPTTRVFDRFLSDTVSSTTT